MFSWNYMKFYGKDVMGLSKILKLQIKIAAGL